MSGSFRSARMRGREVGHSVAYPSGHSTHAAGPVVVSLPGAYDDVADSLRDAVYGRPELLDGVPLCVDCGRSDTFHVASRRFVSRVQPTPTSSFGVGGLDSAYWRKVAGPELTFLGRHLSA